jgi:predicted TIM-barrel fold metal-dependent hydrolase
MGKATTDLDWDRATRVPSVTAPPGTCDCAIHVYGAEGEGRLAGNSTYGPPKASLQDIERVHGILGIQRAVIVQASIYGTDHSLMMGWLRGNPGRYRGIAVVNDSVDDATLAALHEAGVRSARFNILERLGQRLTPEEFRRSVDRVTAMGWSVSLHATVPELLERRALLEAIRAPVILDHMAYFDGSGGYEGEQFRFLQERLGIGGWWVKISRMDRYARPPYDETVERVQRIIGINPDRAVWATDWPHVKYNAAEVVMPNDADLLELLFRYAPDPEIRRNILVNNPAQLFGFNS